jgi:hypothetical protein
MMVGEVRFTETKDPQVLDVSLDFVMPELQPGYYTLHHCNDPCTRQIGATMSTPITGVEDRGQALLAARVERLDSQILRFQPRLRNVIDRRRSENIGLESEIGSLQGEIASLETKIDALQRTVTISERESEASDSIPVAWGWGTAVFLLLTLIAVVGTRHRSDPGGALNYPSG